MSTPALFTPAPMHLSNWPPKYKKLRYDYFLLWGNGTRYCEEILELLDRQPDLEVLKVVRHYPESIEALINSVYSYDYAPIEHLRGKTQYLLNWNTEVIFIFCRNCDAREVYMGKERFRHIECMRIKKIKESVRDIYNPKVGNKRSEDHIIHASDNELQTDHILKYLGYGDGVSYLKRVPNIVLKSPCHLPDFNSFKVIKTDLDNLYCRILTGTRTDFKHEITPLCKTPHYLAMTGVPEMYQKYLAEFGGYLLKDNHSLQHLLNLRDNITYLSGEHKDAYIITECNAPDSFLVLDGVHRASALRAKGPGKCLIGVIA